MDQFSAGRDLLQPEAPLPGRFHRAVGIEPHAALTMSDIVAEENCLIEQVNRKAGSVPVDRKCLDAVLFEVSFEDFVEFESGAEIVPIVFGMDANPAIEQLPILIRCAEEMVMGKHDHVHGFKIRIEAGWAIDHIVFLPCFDAISGMFISQRRYRLQSNDPLPYGEGLDPVPPRALLRGDEAFSPGAAKGAGLRTVTDHVVAAHGADILFFVVHSLTHLHFSPSQLIM
jgi:hypothetical protein